MRGIFKLIVSQFLVKPRQFGRHISGSKSSYRNLALSYASRAPGFMGTPVHERIHSVRRRNPDSQISESVYGIYRLLRNKWTFARG